MSKILKKQDIKHVLYGATFLGAGGGGTLKDGLRLLSEVSKNGQVELEMIDPLEMKSNEYAVSVAGIGAPRAMEKSNFGPEAGYAFETMQKLAFFSGKKLKYVMAGELGGFNTMVPMYVAIQKGIPFVDGDGNGRAVPELSTGLYPIFNIPPVPLVLAGKNGDVVAAFLDDPENHTSAENIARHISMAYGMSAAFCTWLVNGKDINEKLAPKSISNAQKIGQSILKIKEENLDVDTEIQKISNCKAICQGEISDIKLKTEGGFDFGTTVIKGTGENKGNTYYVDFKNENLLVRDDSNNVLITVPDLICMLSLDSMEPITNADTEKGMHIALYGVPAPENWWKKEEGFGCWKPILEKVGYSGGAVRY